MIRSVRRLGVVWSAISGKGSPLNTVVVLLHSLVAMSLILVAILISCGFFYTHPMHCVDRSSREPMPEEHLAVCLQYSKAAGYGDGPGSVDYLHSWAPTTIWALVAILLLPRMAMVCASSHKAKAIFLDQFGNARPHHEVYPRLKANLGTFDMLYLKAVCIDVWAMIVQLVVVLTVNLILLPGKVVPILRDFPWHRDAETYTDPISIAFPSFLSCRITPDAHLQGLRGSYYGCYHSMATFYLGLFFVVAIAVLALFVVTFLHLLYLVVYLPTPWGRRHLINRGRVHDHVNGLPLHLGDLLMLEFGKQYVSGREYADVFNFEPLSQQPAAAPRSEASSSSSDDEPFDVVVAEDAVEPKPAPADQSRSLLQAIATAADLGADSPLLHCSDEEARELSAQLKGRFEAEPSSIIIGSEAPHPGRATLSQVL